VTDADLCKVDVVVQGEVVLEQDGRQARLHAGDFAFVDLSRPAHWTNGWSTRVVAIAFPRQLLPLRADDVAGLTAVGLPGDDGLGAVFSSTARQLARQVDHLDPAGGARVGTAALDLLTVALAGRLGRKGEVPPDVGQRALLPRVRAFIEGRLADSELTPAAVARAHNVSLRSLYKLFEGEQTSVAGLIRERRLERCRRDLLDPSLAARPVSAIATRWGLTNAAHFSRAFRTAYGVSPVEYRRLGGGAHPAA
jgi:AraC-like DNA-binding protein